MKDEGVPRTEWELSNTHIQKNIDRTRIATETLVKQNNELQLTLAKFFVRNEERHSRNEKDIEKIMGFVVATENERVAARVVKWMLGTLLAGGLAYAGAFMASKSLSDDKQQVKTQVIK